MSASDKLAAGMHKTAGKAEELLGRTTSDDGKVLAGKAKQSKAGLQLSVEHAKDAVKRTVGR